MPLLCLILLLAAPLGVAGQAPQAPSGRESFVRSSAPPAIVMMALPRVGQAWSFSVHASSAGGRKPQVKVEGSVSGRHRVVVTPVGRNRWRVDVPGAAFVAQDRVTITAVHGGRLATLRRGVRPP